MLIALTMLAFSISLVLTDSLAGSDIARAERNAMSYIALLVVAALSALCIPSEIAESAVLSQSGCAANAAAIVRWNSISSLVKVQSSASGVCPMPQIIPMTAKIHRPPMQYRTRDSVFISSPFYALAIALGDGRVWICRFHLELPEPSSAESRS